MIAGALAALGGLGMVILNGLGLGMFAAQAVTVGAVAAGAGTGVAAAALGNVGSVANPLIAGGYQNAISDAYNNAVSGSSHALNGLNLPGIPHVQIN